MSSLKYAGDTPSPSIEETGPAPAAAPFNALDHGRSPMQQARRRLAKDRLAMIGLIFLGLVALLSLLAPLLAPHDPIETNLSQRLVPPGTPGYLLGADDLGRDILSRLIWGGRISLLIGFSAVLAAMVAGVLIGLVAGYFGGRLDALIMRLVDILMAFPALLLAITIVASLGPGLRNSMLAVSIVGIPFYVRIVRSSVLSLREQEFSHAARLTGATHLRILARHILPNSLAPLIVASTLDVGFFIMAAAGLSFLGLGAQPPTAEWGVMLSQGRQFIRNAPHLSIVPGMAIFLVVLALNLVGDGLRDALDPRLQE
jgi:peptide/nickel transport system permease protein